MFALCAEFGVEVVIINQSEQPIGFEEELTKDVLEITTVFSVRLYGSRSHKNKQLVEKLRQATESHGFPSAGAKPPLVRITTPATVPTA